MHMYHYVWENVHYYYYSNQIELARIASTKYMYFKFLFIHFRRKDIFI